ncbi:helix-turn-helix domain-containing protein [Burkholderia cenocepacia]|nr:helix-turn-helix domain-containing protein [Burkholderia cenocepacia]
MSTKKPSKAGTCNGRARLNDDDVRRMRSMWKQGAYSQRVLAKLFGCSKGTVWYVVHRHQWRHI